MKEGDKAEHGIKALPFGSAEPSAEPGLGGIGGKNIHGIPLRLDANRLHVEIRGKFLLCLPWV
jgi:hypothetical protein